MMPWSSPEELARGVNPTRWIPFVPLSIFCNMHDYSGRDMPIATNTH